MAFKTNYTRQNGSKTQMNFTDNEVLLMRSIIQGVLENRVGTFITHLYVHMFIARTIQSECEECGSYFNKEQFIRGFFFNVKYRFEDWDLLDVAYNKKYPKATDA
jgi:hypothetical protein